MTKDDLIKEMRETLEGFIKAWETDGTYVEHIRRAEIVVKASQGHHIRALRSRKLNQEPRPL